MADDAIINSLKALSFFSGLSEEQLGIVSTHIKIHELEAEKTLFEEGDRGDSVYFIIDGTLEVLMESDWGEKVKLADLTRGGSVGEMSVIDDLPRSASIASVTAATVLSLDKEHFDQIIEDHPSIGVIMLKGLARFLSKHVRESNESLSDFLEPI